MRKAMGIFTPKSRRETAFGYATAAIANARVKNSAKAVGGAAVGLATVIAASAAISAVRQQEQS
jgi:hypothetical protein